ncbi:MAG: glycoside hydrolase family protein, partial [Labilithrix sp.]|nr:glycoside hydrolase family protein [Labilithrix sp.]
AASTAGCKRGVAYGHHSTADMQALSKGISWWYNWHFEPDAAVAGVFGAMGLEYVPMVWGANVATADVEQRAPASARTLLGFNEPNFFEQADLSAAEAAARWPSVQAVADARGLALVSPAVNFCGGGCHDGDPFAYLDAFFAACPGCRVDAIGVHVYVGCKGANGNHAQWLIDHIRTYERRFAQPIWLTEFACDDAASPEEQRAFLIDAVEYLEDDPRIERYAWFAGRADNVAHVDLLGADGELTALGQAYVDLPHNAACGR